jgi:hypothetical protein
LAAAAAADGGGGVGEALEFKVKTIGFVVEINDLLSLF